MGLSKHSESRELRSAVNPGQLIKLHCGLEDTFFYTVYLHLFSFHVLLQETS